MEKIVPRYGSISEDIDLVIIFKGRVFKDNVTIIWNIPQLQQNSTITNFTLNGNVAQVRLPKLNLRLNHQISTMMHIFSSDHVLGQFPFYLLPANSEFC